MYVTCRPALPAAVRCRGTTTATEATEATAAAYSVRYPGRATADNIMRVYAPEGLAPSLARRLWTGRRAVPVIILTPPPPFGGCYLCYNIIIFFFFTSKQRQSPLPPAAVAAPPHSRQRVFVAIFSYAVFVSDQKSDPANNIYENPIACVNPYAKYLSRLYPHKATPCKCWLNACLDKRAAIVVPDYYYTSWDSGKTLKKRIHN